MTDGYHHGDLRNALVAAAVKQAREGGPQRVVLRELLRDVGVSHNAAYRHFADRDELIRAVRDFGLEQLAIAMREAVDELPGFEDPVTAALARLRAVGASYIHFALAEPGLFRTAFFTGADQAHSRSDLSATGGTGLDQTQAVAATPPYQMLRACIDDVITAGAIPSERRDQAEFGAWSAVHGISALLLDSPLAGLDDDGRERLIAHVLDMVARGL